MSRACGTSSSGASPIVSEEMATKYNDRIKLLKGTAALLEEEPAVCPPKLSALESTKGMMFAGYARTAFVVKDIGDEAGVSQPVAAAATNMQSAVSNAFSQLQANLRPAPSNAQQQHQQVLAEQELPAENLQNV